MSEKSRNRIALAVIELLLVGVVVVLLLSSLPSKTTPAATPTPAAPALDQIPAPEVPRVSVSEAKQAYDARQAVFVDVRTLGQYNTRHVAGAVSIPLADIEQRLNELDKAQWIIPYCT